MAPLQQTNERFQMSYIPTKFSTASRMIQAQADAIVAYNEASKNYSLQDNNAFLCGYLMSQMASYIADLPVARQKVILADIQRTTNLYAEKTSTLETV